MRRPKSHVQKWHMICREYSYQYGLKIHYCKKSPTT